MADTDRIRATIEQYVLRFSQGDRDGWLSLWADGATMEDPIGTPVKQGRDEIAAFYDANATLADSVELRMIGEPLICGHEAAFRFDARPTIGGQVMSMPVIDVMTFDADARITSQRAFQDFGLLAPSTDG